MEHGKRTTRRAAGVSGAAPSRRWAVWAVAGAMAVCGSSATAQTAPAVEPTAPADTTQEFEFRGGRWIPLAERAPTTLPSDPTLDRAEDFLQRGGWRAARTLLLRWFRTHDRRHPLRDRATFLLAEVYFMSGDRIRSFYHFDEVMDLYPDSPLYPLALQRQYDIADAYLRGFKNRLFGLPILSAQDEAIEMLFRIQTRAPGSPLAERALLRTADFYYATSQFDLAADAYASYVSSYPRSPLAPRARLRQAFALMAQFRGTRFDATPLTDARELLSDLIVTQPELSKEEALPAVVGRIDDAQARKLLQTADWYRRTNQLRGAAYLYRLLVLRYPESADAAEARARLARLPASALQDPEPAAEAPMLGEDLAGVGGNGPTAGPATREGGAR